MGHYIKTAEIVAPTKQHIWLLNMFYNIKAIRACGHCLVFVPFNIGDGHCGGLKVQFVNLIYKTSQFDWGRQIKWLWERAFFPS